MCIAGWTASVHVLCCLHASARLISAGNSELASNHVTGSGCRLILADRVAFYMCCCWWCSGSTIDVVLIMSLTRSHLHVTWFPSDHTLEKWESVSNCSTLIDYRFHCIKLSACFNTCLEQTPCRSACFCRITPRTGEFAGNVAMKESRRVKAMKKAPLPNPLHPASL